MINEIIVNVSELRSAIQDVRRSGSDVVKIIIDEPDLSDKDDIVPASVSFSSTKSHEPDTWIDYEPVFSVENESELEVKYLNGIHMSDNLL